LKRSNRLVLLIGIFLALVAFVLVAVTLKNGSGQGTGPSAPPTTASVVIAARDLALGTKITADAVTTKTIALVDKPKDSYSDTSQVIGQTARQSVAKDQLITSEILNNGGAATKIEVPPGFVAIAVQVDQTTGVGTLIKPGDNVDVVVGITGADKVPEVINAPTPTPRVTPRPNASASPSPSPIPGSANFAPVPYPYNPTTVKTVVQGLQVLVTLLPPADTTAPAASGQTSGGTSLNGQQEIVILAATAQQVEAIKFSQMDGTISLVLRSAKDCQATDGTASPCPIVTTTGITLRKMVDVYGVLPPQVVEVIEPTPYPSPKK
jgi:Flp pilus assembly protein CpaB